MDIFKWLLIHAAKKTKLNQIVKKEYFTNCSIASQNFFLNMVVYYISLKFQYQPI